jgi:hypothetical protein
VIKKFSQLYGAHPMQLVVLIAALALAGYAALHVARDVAWMHILIWFLAAVIGHDLILFPLYAAADGLLVRAVSRWRAVNYLRVPALAAGLTFVLFLPGIIMQGAGSYHAATGLTQAPFLGRWLLLVTGFFAVSAVLFVVRRLLPRRRSAGPLNVRRGPGTPPVALNVHGPAEPAPAPSRSNANGPAERPPPR